MKKIGYALLATVSGLVLLLSYRTSLEVVTPTAATGTGTGTTDASSPGSTGSTGSSGSTDSTDSTGSTGSSAPTQSLTDGTFTGAAASTRFGPVQVQITVSGGAIVAAQAVEYPTENPRDRQINQVAIPLLVSETVSAGNAQIDMISGATYTSEGYLQSLQSAIDEASA